MDILTGATYTLTTYTMQILFRTTNLIIVVFGQTCNKWGGGGGEHMNIITHRSLQMSSLLLVGADATLCV